MKKAVILISFISIFNFTNAQWQQTNGPYGGDIYCLATNGTNIFAGTLYGKAYASSNNGNSWTEVNKIPTKWAISSLACSGTNIFAGTEGDGVFLSTNNGNSWTPVNIGLTNTTTNTFVKTLAFSGANIFAGTYPNGVFLSTNNGSSWTAVNSGLTDLNLRSLVISGSNIYVGTFNSGVFLSTNNGSSWIAVNNGLANLPILSLAASGTNIYAGNYGGGVFLSTNNGSSWTAVNNGLTNPYVRSLMVTGTNVYAGTGGGGVFLSTNNGSSWTEINSGLNALPVTGLLVNGANIFAGTDGGVFLSNNNGNSWVAINNGITKGVYIISKLVSNGTNIFAGTNGGGIFLSTNNGNSWAAVNNGLTNLGNYSITDMAVSGTNIFAANYRGGVFLSTNNGSSWTAVNSGLTDLNIYALAASGTTIFAGTEDGLIFLSTDNGSSWKEADNGITCNIGIYSLMFNGQNIFAGTPCGIYLSTDNGDSWTAINNGLTVPFAVSMLSSGENIYASNGYNGISLSTNNGNDWTPMNDGLSLTSNNYFGALAVSESNIYLGGTGGVWYRPLNCTHPTSPTISASGTTTLCQGVSVTLTSNAVAGNQWYKDGIAINGSIASTLNVNTSGSYSSRVTLNECTSEPSNSIIVTVNGCDDDEDGVMNDKDLCPNTISGTNVNANGCFFLPSNNFSIEVIGETCVDKNNGKISISAQATHNYVATFNGANHNFTNNSLSVSNLAPGTYNVCIKITGVIFEQCFTITIAEGKTVSGKSGVTSNKTSIDISEGTAPYNVFINGINVLNTVSPSFMLDVKHGDLVEVKTAVLCEGVFSKTIDLFEGVKAYPNPTKGIFEITLPFSVKEVYIELFSVGSQLISKGTYQVVNGKVQLNLENKPTGVYVVKIYLDTPVSLTIIKE